MTKLAGIISCIIIINGCTTPSQELETGSFTAELNGFAIHYEVHGSGPVLMTVPNSWGLSLEGLRALYRPLEQHMTMVYFDPRGMGGSEAAREETDLGAAAVREDFHALREHLGLERVHAIGWSNGASNLMLLASEHPDTIDAAVFLHGIASFGLDVHAAGTEMKILVLDAPRVDAFGIRWIAQVDDIDALVAFRTVDHPPDVSVRPVHLLLDVGIGHTEPGTERNVRQDFDVVATRLFRRPLCGGRANKGEKNDRGSNELTNGHRIPHNLDLPD